MDQKRQSTNAEDVGHFSDLQLVFNIAGAWGPYQSGDKTSKIDRD